MTGGGLADSGRSWRSCRPGFFLPVRVLSRLFRRLFLRGLTELFRMGRLQFHGSLEAQRPLLPHLVTELGRAEWVVYAKPPFGGPAQVVEYLGRYTHRVAISNQRLLGIEDRQVVFQFKDYRSNGRHAQRRMTLDANEFIRRFLLHTLPPGFTRIRHYGLLAGRNKKKLLPTCVELLQNAASCLPSLSEVVGYERLMLSPAVLCPECHTGHMIHVERLPASHVRKARALDSS